MWKFRGKHLHAYETKLSDFGIDKYMEQNYPTRGDPFRLCYRKSFGPTQKSLNPTQWLKNGKLVYKRQHFHLIYGKCLPKLLRFMAMASHRLMDCYNFQNGTYHNCIGNRSYSGGGREGQEGQEIGSWQLWIIYVRCVQSWDAQIKINAPNDWWMAGVLLVTSSQLPSHQFLDPLLFGSSHLNMGIGQWVTATQGKLQN